MVEPGDRIALPPDRYYDVAAHLWVQPTSDPGRVIIGIDAVGLEYIGELAYLQCAPPGTRLSRGDVMGSMEAAKMTDTLASPLSGEIRAVNDAAMRNPAIVNRDPYGDGWIAELSPARWDAEREMLASGSRIAEYGDAESARLRDPSPSRP